MRYILTMLAAAALALPAHAEIARSSVPKRQYAAEHPCPSTGKRSPAGCTNFVIDHLRPLCSGGRDVPENMMWQRKPESLRKDREELRLCRKIAAGVIPKGLSDVHLCKRLPAASYPMLRNAFCVKT